MIDPTNPAHLLLVTVAAIILMILGSFVEDDEKENIQFVALCTFGVCIIMALYSVGALIYQNL